jgi:hypothetical protein
MRRFFIEERCMNGWRILLEDGRWFNWTENDRIWSEREAVIKMLTTDPDAVIELVEQVEVLRIIPLSTQ